MRGFDVLDQLARIECPTLVCVGELDPITPVAAAREIADALPEGIAQLAVVEDAGHFTWKDAPDRYWPLVTDFVTTTTGTKPPELSSNRRRILHEDGNPVHRLRVEHDRARLYVELSGEDGGNPWTVLAVDRASRNYVVAQGDTKTAATEAAARALTELLASGAGPAQARHH